MKKQFGMLIDQHRCIGCRTCMIACKMEHRLPDGVSRMKVYNQEDSIINDRPTLIKGKTELFWTPTPCMHCAKPKCVEVCPVNAIIKRDDGIVFIDHDKCNGCEQCIAACPYGVPEFMGEYKKADKCDLCKHRVDVGKQPICIECCPSRAISIGDISNQNSGISKKIATELAMQLEPGTGTIPSVYYMNLK